MRSAARTLGVPVAVGLWLGWLLGCAASAERGHRRWPDLEAVAEPAEAAAGPDAAPRWALAFVYDDGSRIPIEERARAFARFRDGVALVDEARRLLLISPRGARRVLAGQAGASPVRGSGGELVYVARHGLRAELHVLRAEGDNRVVASGFANAGVLAPQRDGRVLFVAARSGGVAGLWIADAAGARCLTNCELSPARSGWGDDFVPSPGDSEAIELRGDRVYWDAFDGTRRVVVLSAPDGRALQAAPGARAPALGEAP